MPLALLVALAASLGIHAMALFGTDAELFGGADEPVPLQVELQPPPAPPAAAPKALEGKPTAKKPAAKPHPKVSKPVPLASSEPSPEAKTVVPAPENENIPVTPAPELPTASPSVAPPAPEPAKPLLPAKGTMRFNIYYGTQGFLVGRAEHTWEFTEDGHYHLIGTTRTSGLAALLKPLVFESESSGRLVAGGLQPETYRTRRNGKDSNENADFDWSTGAVRLSRSGDVQAVAKGTQDILSLNYQMAYLRNPEMGTNVGVVTGKKYDRFELDSLGEEEIDTAAGHFRTLHLRVIGDTVTEIWIALDLHRLPVKIRYTDKKGDIFEQVATEIGSP
jgi:hypothetical protein